MGFTSMWYNVLPRKGSETDLPLGLFVAWCVFKEISGMLFTSLVLTLGLFRLFLRSSGYRVQGCSFASAQNISLSEYFKIQHKSPCN